MKDQQDNHDRPQAKPNPSWPAGAEPPTGEGAAPTAGHEVRYQGAPPAPGQRLCVAAPGPYPKPQVRAASPEYAALLLEDYAGQVSETTATMQYMYHHFVAPESVAWIGEMLKSIAIVEMHHIELLGETIKLLGGDPRYYDSDGTYWDARRVYYGDTFRAQLEADAKAEREAIAQYERHYKMIEDPYIRQLLVRIIADEQLHLYMFEWALNFVS